METDFDYKLIRSARRSLSVTITRENEITVRAPLFLSEQKIRSFIRQKSGWIEKHLLLNAQKKARFRERRFAHGETFSFLGEDYTLEIYEAPKSRFECGGNIFRVYLPPHFSITERRDTAAWRIEDWARVKIHETLNERIDFFEKQMKVRASRLRVRQFESQWGSCSSRGGLSFNWKLVLAPLEIVDYVVVHELAHLLHPNHSDSFWKAVGAVLSDYEERRNWLRRNGLHLSLEKSL